MKPPSPMPRRTPPAVGKETSISSGMIAVSSAAVALLAMFAYIRGGSGIHRSEGGGVRLNGRPCFDARPQKLQRLCAGRTGCEHTDSRTDVQAPGGAYLRCHPGCAGYSDRGGGTFSHLLKVA